MSVSVIYPDIFPSNYDPKSSEKYYYKRLKKELPDEYRVYYSLKLFTPDVNRREIDFLILGPRGILVIELKNSRWRITKKGWEFYKSREDSWAHSEKKYYSNPIEQSKTALQTFKTFLMNHNGMKPPGPDQAYCHAVIFAKNDDVISGMKPDQARFGIFRNEINKKSFKEIIGELENRICAKAPGENDLEEIHNIILRNTSLVQTFSHKQKIQKKRFLQLTREQFYVIYDFEKKGKMICSGRAGSGKTVLAVEAAIREAKRERKVLLVCHSSNLNSYLKRKCSEYENIHVRTIVSLCREIILEFEKDFGQKKDPSGKKEEAGKAHEDFLKKILPEKTLEFADHCSLTEKYDTVIIDEGQDILTEQEILIFDSLLKKGFSEGRWILFYDPDQALQGEFHTGLDFLMSKKPLIQDLPYNIRTPSQVYDIACRISGRTPYSKLPDVSGVHLVSFKDEEEALFKLVGTIENAIRTHNLNPEDIVILSPKKKKHTVGIGERRKLKNYSIKLVDDGDIEEGKIGFAEISRFKGLECPYVILMGMEDFHSDFYNQYYVALTRATSGASILYPLSRKKQIEKLLGQEKK